MWIVSLLESMLIYCTQYLVGAPFTWITTSIRRGMEVNSLWHWWGGMEAQVSLTVALRLICISWSLLRGFAFICGLCIILWQANWFINITDILLSHNTGLYLLHRKKIDIYANISLFLYSLEPIWSVSSPDGHCSHQIQSVFRSDGGSAPRDDLYSSERQRRSWKILVLRVTPSNKILREFLEMWAFPLKIKKSICIVKSAIQIKVTWLDYYSL